jgi:hypothetical protein
MNALTPAQPSRGPEATCYTLSSRIIYVTLEKKALASSPSCSPDHYLRASPDPRPKDDDLDTYQIPPAQTQKETRVSSVWIGAD